LTQNRTIAGPLSTSPNFKVEGSILGFLRPKSIAMAAIFRKDSWPT
jgi:hypothetical protein